MFCKILKNYQYKRKVLLCEFSFEWSHCRISSTNSATDTQTHCVDSDEARAVHQQFI